jgi:acyl phosphate:glycerol-3-phosphate acyltransferase
LGSLVLALFIPVMMWILDYSGILIGLMLVITVMSVWRHRVNIRNLIRGKERKISFRGEKA